MATLEEEYKKYQGEGYDQINSLYDAQRQATLSGLEQAYNQNLSSAEAARDQTSQQYQARANDLGAQYERNRKNLNEQAAANGLNTGTGSQMQLALNNNYMKGYGQVRTAEQQALDEANRGIENLKASYQSSVQQAVADNDYQRAQALLAEYQRQYQQKLQQAQQLASYGDFSAYLNIPGYDQASVDSMRNAWIASNPDLAYNTGAISADQYYNMTGWHSPYEQQQMALDYARQQDAYNREQDAYNREQNEKAWQLKEAQNAQSSQQQAYSNLYSLIASTGYRPSDEELAAAGMSRGAADALANYFATYGAGAGTTYSTRRSTGGSGGTGGNGGNGGTGGSGIEGDLNGDGVLSEDEAALLSDSGNKSIFDKIGDKLREFTPEQGGAGLNSSQFDKIVSIMNAADDTTSALDAIVRSPYYDQMSDEQRRLLAQAYKEATRTPGGGTGTQGSGSRESGLISKAARQLAFNSQRFIDAAQRQQTPTLRTGDPGYYVNPALRTGRNGRGRMSGESNRSALLK